MKNFYFSKDQRYCGTKEEVSIYEKLLIEKSTIQDKLRTGISFFDNKGEQIFILQEIFECEQDLESDFNKATNQKEIFEYERNLFQDIINDKVCYIKVNDFNSYLCLISIFPLDKEEDPMIEYSLSEECFKEPRFFTYTAQDFYESTPISTYEKILKTR